MCSESPDKLKLRGSFIAHGALTLFVLLTTFLFGISLPHFLPPQVPVGTIASQSDPGPQSLLNYAYGANASTAISHSSKRPIYAYGGKASTQRPTGPNPGPSLITALLPLLACRRPRLEKTRNTTTIPHPNLPRNRAKQIYGLVTRASPAKRPKTHSHGPHSVLFWPSRDPIGEGGGVNLYGMVGNYAVGRIDFLGLKDAEGGKVKPKKPCKKNGKILKFVFDGVSFSGNGLNVQATAGMPIEDKTTPQGGGGFKHTIIGSQQHKVFDYSKERQKIPDIGPTPEGSYWINNCWKNDYKNAWRHKLVDPRRIGWGAASWELYADEGTETYGRDKMFLHGGIEPTSRGCIDAFGGGIDKIVKVIDEIDEIEEPECCCYITIIVKYKHEKVTAKRARYTSWKNGMLDSSYDSGWHLLPEKPEKK